MLTKHQVIKSHQNKGDLSKKFKKFMRIIRNKIIAINSYLHCRRRGRPPVRAAVGGYYPHRTCPVRGL